ncbi:MAG: MBL fold metallo-hydrolase [Clostridia bacterium]|nr:MBL fold metallo-hydrolase [Clostridia bacterium]
MKIVRMKLLNLLLSAACVLFPHFIVASTVRAPLLNPVPNDLRHTDCIHFLPTGTSDAILLESDGHFALVDAGEDSDNPRGFDALSYAGHEQEVLAYLKAHAADQNGKVYLDFVVGTHSHSDHIGGFDTIILDPDVTIGRAYLKTYDSTRIRDSEITEWDNQEVYDQMADALRSRNVSIISEPDGTPFTLGHFTVTLFNTDDPVTAEKVGENDNSLGVLIEKNGTRVFLAGDINNESGDEKRLAPQIGRVDLLKVGHHSYEGSSSGRFIRTLRPRTCVVTNDSASVDRNVLARIVHILRHRNIYVTGNEGGVLAVIGDGGEITYFGGIAPNADTDNPQK